MNFSEIQDRIIRLCMIGGWANVDPPPQWGELANEGLRLFSTEVEYMPGASTITTVADTKEYTITAPPAWLSLTDDCTYGTDTPLYLTDQNTVRRQDRMWRQASSDTPRNIWLSKLNTVRLYPPPSAVATVYLYGWVEDTVMSADTDTPNCQPIFHEGIALLGAWHQGKLYARGEEVQIADRFYAEGMKYAERLKEQIAAQGAVVFQMRTQRRPQDRLILGRETRYSQK